MTFVMPSHPGWPTELLNRLILHSFLTFATRLTTSGWLIYPRPYRYERYDDANERRHFSLCDVYTLALLFFSFLLLVCLFVGAQ